MRLRRDRHVNYHYLLLILGVLIFFQPFGALYFFTVSERGGGHITGAKNGVKFLSGPTAEALDCNHYKIEEEDDIFFGGIRVAFIGNSIQYFNDCPRFMEALVNPGMIAFQDSCFYGNQSLVSLLEKGNGMSIKFHTPNAVTAWNETSGEAISWDIGAPTIKDLLVKEDGWDFVVLNDYTQSAARLTSRTKTIDSLLNVYVPYFEEAARQRQDRIVSAYGYDYKKEMEKDGKASNCGQLRRQSHTLVPVFLMTAAYRDHGVKHSEDLGTYDEFTAANYEGYLAYRDAVASSSSLAFQPRIAPVGLGFQRVHNEDRDLWTRLYHSDGFHPSPAGTYLQGCILHCTLFRSIPIPAPPADEEAITQLWALARRMQPPDDPPNPFPTVEECAYLRKVAEDVCMEHRETVRKRDAEKRNTTV